MQATSVNSSGRVRDCLEEQNEFFCEEIRQFVNDSRGSQTVYANFEESNERTVKCNELTMLDDLIFLTLSDGKDRASLTPDEFAKTEKLTKLIAKKIYVSRMKFKCNEIRLQVVWIYYFNYLEKEMKAMPVFKVYKRSSGPEALYIDIGVVEYDSWDHFIVHSQFPASFICVPRRGEYTFRGIDGRDMLDLEYICKNSQLLNKSYRNIRPFSQTLIQQMLHNAMPFVKTVRPFLDLVMKFAEVSGLHTHPVARLIVQCTTTVAIFLRVMELKWERKVSEEALESSASDYTVMLLNNKEQNPSCWMKFANLIYDVVEHLLRDRSWIDIMNSLKNPWENWREILKFVPMLTEICKPFISEVSGVEGAVLSVLLEFIPKLLSQTTEKEEIKEKGSEESDNWLYNLERYSSANVFSELKASSRLSPGKEILRPSLGIEGLQESGFDLFGFRVYLLLKHTEPDCKRFLQRLLKLKYSLQEGICFQNVIHDGNSIGVVIPFSFQSQNHAIVVLHLDNLSKVRNKRKDRL